MLTRKRVVAAGAAATLSLTAFAGLQPASAATGPHGGACTDAESANSITVVVDNHDGTPIQQRCAVDVGTVNSSKLLPAAGYTQNEWRPLEAGPTTINDYPKSSDLFKGWRYFTVDGASGAWKLVDTRVGLGFIDVTPGQTVAFSYTNGYFNQAGPSKTANELNPGPVLSNLKVAVAGASATASFVADDATDTAQWQLDGAKEWNDGPEIKDDKTASWSLGGGLTAGNHTVTVKLTNKAGKSAQFSQSFTIQAAAELITAQPQPVTAAPGTDATFTVKTIDGGAGLTFQWQKQDAEGKWQNVEGATSATLVVPKVTAE
ncbi:hypothetical protein [Propionibacterium freudenreichii]|uniref:Secreted protein n=1 Tax=Propionibacterium freudenreichii TaxID=1744 RepID=A0A509MCX3_9ACTN|nr:hypothetical protein [Propionibacterium freudenreichii]SCQ75600.1 Hypothetical protein PFR_JS23_462 [Propionibacterium freudenreichii]